MYEASGKYHSKLGAGHIYIMYIVSISYFNGADMKREFDVYYLFYSFLKLLNINRVAFDEEKTRHIQLSIELFVIGIGKTKKLFLSKIMF